MKGAEIYSVRALMGIREPVFVEFIVSDLDRYQLSVKNVKRTNGKEGSPHARHAL